MASRIFSLLVVAISMALAVSTKLRAAPVAKDDLDTASPEGHRSSEGRPVMTWVAPYAIEKSKAMLNESFEGEGLQTAITHLALQFWIPGNDGGIQPTDKYGEISDETISSFSRWGRAHGVRVLLCVYNYIDAWNWARARSVFADHPKEFADALVAQVEKHHLDGVDIDLEGEGAHEEDKQAFTGFIRDLSAKLHAKGKQLTVDSFCDRWNAPNQTWWADLFPHVDALTSMGYEELGHDAEDWRAYAAQKAASGLNSAKLLIGVPSHKDEWRNHPALDHIDWIAADGGMGIAIWDAQLSSPVWRKTEIWAKIRKISGRPEGK